MNVPARSPPAARPSPAQGLSSVRHGSRSLRPTWANRPMITVRNLTHDRSRKGAIGALVADEHGRESGAEGAAAGVSHRLSTEGGG